MGAIDRARRLRPMIEKLSQRMDDNEALNNVELHPVWKPGMEFVVNPEDGLWYVDEVSTGNLAHNMNGPRIVFEGVLYRVLQQHTSQEGWEPNITPSLYAKVLIPDDERIYDWEQPGSTNPYMTGEKVKHVGKIWTSDVDNNVWEPGVYGWTEVVEEEE